MANSKRKTRLNINKKNQLKQKSRRASKAKKARQKKNSGGKTKSAKFRNERKLEKKRIAERARRQKIKDDPIKYQVACAKERKRWQMRKATGKVKNIADMTEREKRIRRKKVKKWVQTYRQRNKQKNSSNEIENQSTEVNLNRRTIQRRKQKRLQDKKNYRELQNLKKKNTLLKKRLACLRKAKLRQEQKKLDTAELSPRSTVQKLIKQNDVSEIRKKLEAGEVLKRQIQEIYKTNNDHKSKELLRRITRGKIVKQNGMCQRLKEYAPLQSKSTESKRFSVYIPKKRHRTKMSLEKTVMAFFEDNSRMCPGKNDCITRKGFKKQKMFLNESVRMLYFKFKQTYSSLSISYTLFSTMRPFWTIPEKVSERSTRLCTKHENMKLLIECLYRGHVINECNFTSLLSSLTCTPCKEDCLTRTCKFCKKKEINFNDIPENKSITFQEWVSIKETRTSIKTKAEICVTRNLKKTDQQTVAELKLKLHKNIQPFMHHVLRINHQYEVIKNLKNSLTDNDALFHIDFSENYNCKYAAEVQTVHFGASRESISLHTGVCYLKDSHQSFCTASKSLRHDSSAIVAHLIPVLREMLKNAPHIKHLHFLSDAPTTQYRNKTTYGLLTTYLMKIFDQVQKITYNFSESGHGKGAADGIGAVVKRTADRLVANGQDVHDFETFFDGISKNTESIYLAAVTESEILSVEQQIPANLETFIGTMKIHQWKWHRLNSNVIRFNTMSCYDCKHEKKCTHYHLGEWQIARQSAKKIISVRRSTRRR